MKKPITLVSVCYNHAPYLIESLESIKAQTFPDFQWILIDDCSQDGSAEKIQEWIDENRPDCQFIAHRENQGLCASLNEALKLAKGKYFAMCSTDDVLLPQKLEIQFHEMETLPESVGVLYSDALLIDEKGIEHSETHLEKFLYGRAIPSGSIFSELLRGNFIPVAATLIRMECFERVGEFDETLSFEDLDLWLRIAHRFSFEYSTYTASKFRIKEHPDWHPFAPQNQRVFFETETKIHEKCLAISSLSKRERKAIEEAVAKRAIHHFLRHHPRRRELLIKALQESRSIKLMLCMVFHLFVPSKMEKKITKWVLEIYLRQKKGRAIAS